MTAEERSHLMFISCCTAWASRGGSRARLGSARLGDCRVFEDDGCVCSAECAPALLCVVVHLGTTTHSWGTMCHQQNIQLVSPKWRSGLRGARRQKANLLPALLFISFFIDFFHDSLRSHFVQMEVNSITFERRLIAPMLWLIWIVYF